MDLSSQFVLLYLEEKIGFKMRISREIFPGPREAKRQVDTKAAQGAA
jgi:hypothetical protein